MKTATYLQEIYFDVCDIIAGLKAKDIGYDSTKDMMKEFKWKLEAIEADLRLVLGVELE